MQGVRIKIQKRNRPNVAWNPTESIAIGFGVFIRDHGSSPCVDHPANQATNQVTDQMAKTTNRLTYQTTYRPNDQSTDRPTDRPTNKSSTRPRNQSTNQSNNQATDQPALTLSSCSQTDKHVRRYQAFPSIIIRPKTPPKHLGMSNK